MGKIVDLASFTDEELKNLQDKIRVEQTERQRKEKVKLWNDVVKAIKAYTDCFGEIKIEYWGTTVPIEFYNLNTNIPGSLEMPL